MSVHFDNQILADWSEVEIYIKRCYVDDVFVDATGEIMLTLVGGDGYVLDEEEPESFYNHSIKSGVATNMEHYNEFLFERLSEWKTECAELEFYRLTEFCILGEPEKEYAMLPYLDFEMNELIVGDEN